LTAFDASDNVLGTFDWVGNSNGNSDNSAIFIGVNDNTASISKLAFSVPIAPANPQDFAINRLAIDSVGGNCCPLGNGRFACGGERSYFRFRFMG
jgi:hypothetical protein